MITRPCEKCQGRGTIEMQKEIIFQIPRGADDGESIKIEGEGEPGGEGGPTGNLYIRLQIKPHPIFGRRGSDIYVKRK